MDLKNELLTAFQQGDFLRIVYEKSLHERENIDSLVTEIVTLNNEKELDILGILKELDNSENGNYWHLIYDVFSKVIPKLDVPVLLVIECISFLIKNVKNVDLIVYNCYVDFCNVDENRFKEALLLIESDISELIGFINYTLIAGSKLDIEYYLNASLRLLQHKNIEVRRIAVSSLGSLQYLERPDFSEQAISAFENVANETDSDFLVNLVWAAFDLYKQDKSKESRVVKLVTDIIWKNENILQSTARLFQHSNFLPFPLLDIYFSHLSNNIEIEDNKSRINLGLYWLLHQNQEKGINFLENVLIKNDSIISLNDFGSVFSFLSETKNLKLLNRLATRWFFRGDRVLCDGIHEIANQFIMDNILLSIELSELDVTNSNDFIFIARKAIGYLFTHPVTVASIIISLIEHTNDIELIHTLGGFLVDPLLMNYQGKLKDYLTKQLDSQNKNVRIIVEQVLNASDDYFNNLKSVGDIPELNPSQAQREAYWRRDSHRMSESMKAAEKQSVLSHLCSKSVLLYGNKSIMYVEGFGNEEPRRMEMPLHSIELEYEYPRTGHIDSFGLNQMLLVFQAEQRKL